MKKEEDYSGYIAFVKYDGDSVAEGFLDARAAAEALMGFDEGIRYYLTKAGVEGEYEIPVRIRKGTWEALIPETLLGWVLAGGSIVATTYLSTAAAQMAKNDFKDASLGSLIQGAVTKMQRVVKIKKHLEGEDIKNVKTSFKNDGYTIILKSRRGDLEVTKDDLEDYVNYPRKAVSRLARNIREDRTLSLGVVKDTKVTEEQVSFADRDYFYAEQDDENDELFPELTDGLEVLLEGKLIRGNQDTNSLGLKYKGHVLNCKPGKGEVNKYKQQLFTECAVNAIVDRTTARKQGKKKPYLIVTSIESKDEESDAQQSMFQE